MNDLFQQMSEINYRLSQLLRQAGCQSLFGEALVRLPAPAFDKMLRDAEGLGVRPKVDPETRVEIFEIFAIRVARAPGPGSG